MRDIASWGKQLRKALRNSEDLKEYVAESLANAGDKVKLRELVRLAQLIAEVELGLTLLREVAPEDPATSVSALLSGYRFPVEPLLSDENWQLVQKARFYLVRRKGRQWERSLLEYIQLPEIIRIYNLKDPSDVPQLIPSSTYPHRLQLYRQTLSTTPIHSCPEVKLATEGRWYAKISQKGNSPVEVPIDIPKVVADIAPLPLVALYPTRTTPKNPTHTVTLDELLEEAQEMDRKLAEAEYKAENYHQRLSGVALRLYDAQSDNFHPGTKLNIEGLIHIVGLLNVGKSTLLEILIYHLAKQGYRCGLIVNDVVAAVRLASLFEHRLKIPAAPVLGSDRSEQLEKVYEPILLSGGQEIYEGGMHPAWRWFSPVCPLLALVQSEDKWDFGQEPCHDLYQKTTTSKNRNSDAQDEDLDERESNRFTCPLYYKCPRHQLEQDIAEALVWVLTPASLIHTRVPRQVFKENIRFAEAVYRECDFLFVDEADRVQVQLDEAFAPDEVLLDNSGNSFLNKLGLNVSPIYNSNRSSMAADLFAAWKRAHDYAQIATDLMCHRLYNHLALIEWLGRNPFTGRSLFGHIVRDLIAPPLEEEESESSKKTQLTRTERSQELRRRIKAGLPPEEQRQHRKQVMQTLEGFLQHPLNRRRGGELSDIALTILSTESDARALAEVGDWCKRWLESLGISLPDKTKFEELSRNLHFAILTTVLDDRLGFVVDHLSELSRTRIIDLHDLSEALVHRPPRDYLPVVPESPVGNILGFRYNRDYTSNKGGKLEYFRYVGVGRALLLNFPKLFAVDGRDGPHTVLISGTSYAPGSPAYHIKQEPTVLLEPAANNGKAGDAGIGESEFFFSPQQRNGKYIALSGLPPARRTNAANEMVQAICHSPGRATSFLDLLFEGLKQRGEEDHQKWSDRERLLMITGSYNEAECVESRLQLNYRRFEHPDAIATLRRDNAPAELRGIRRGKIQTLKDTPIRL